mgnify:CR=1 FL=1
MFVKISVDENITNEQLYEAIRTDKELSSSQPSPGDILAMWDQILEDGYDEIVYIPMSSGLSNSCQTAFVLAKEFNGKVQVVDNQRISVTQRQSVMDAMALAKAGKCAAEPGAHAPGRTDGGEQTVSNERYEEMTDEQIVQLAQAGEEPALVYLLNKYKNFVRSKARSYFLIGADHEDIVQEGMIGLFKAIRDYREDRLSSFRAFAELCITRQIITAIKTATRQKHIPLNSYVSLNKPIYDEESDRTLLDVITEGYLANPEDVLINREDMSLIEVRIAQSLSPLERQVLAKYLQGKSYQEISRDMKRQIKSIDNALQRVKRKLAKIMEP